MRKLNDAEICTLEHELSALQEARFILTNNTSSKFGVHYIDHPVYQRLLGHIDDQIGLTKQALGLWKDGAIS